MLNFLDFLYHNLKNTIDLYKKTNIPNLNRRKKTEANNTRGLAGLSEISKNPQEVALVTKVLVLPPLGVR